MPDSVILGTDTKTNQPVTLSDEARRQGLYVVGLTGTGKTTLLLNLITQDMEAGRGLCVLDPHADLINSILARVPEERLQDVILLDPTDHEWPFGLNLFECRDPGDPLVAHETHQRVLHVFDKLWGPEGLFPSSAVLLMELLANVTLTLIDNPGYTLVEVPRLLEDQAFRLGLAANLTNAEVSEFWKNQYPPLDKDQREYRESTVRRVREFLRQRIVRNIVGQSHSTVNFRHAMDQRKIVLVPLPVRPLGDATVTLLGAMMISQLLDAAFSREDIADPEQRVPFNLYADEYWRFAISDFATFLAEARKYGVATTIAHQWLTQLDRTNQGAVKSAVNKVVFQVNPDDADEFAKAFDRTPPVATVSGQRPTRAISLNPFDQLLRNGHPYPWVRHQIEVSIKALAADLEMARQSPERSSGKWLGGFQYGATASSLTQAINLINQYFVFNMEHGDEVLLRFKLDHADEVLLPTIPDRSRERIKQDLWDPFSGIVGSIVVRKLYNNEVDNLLDIVIAARGFLCLETEIETSVSYDHAFHRLNFQPSPVELSPEILEILRGVIERGIFYESHAEILQIIRGSTLSKRRLNHDYKPNGDPFHDDVTRWLWLDAKTHPDIGKILEPDEELDHRLDMVGSAWDQLREALIPDTQHKLELARRAGRRDAYGLRAEVGAKTRAYQVRMFLKCVYQIGRALAIEPLTSETGLTEPIYDHARPFADVQHEIANSLVGLPNYTARAKLMQNNQSMEYTIRTQKPRQPAPEQLVQKRVRQIRQAMIDQGYVRSREQVEMEIADRLAKGQPPSRGRSRIEPL